MPITLKIVSYQRHTPGQNDSFSTDRDQISIGRNAENDLALPDPQRFMSGLHCWIEKQDDGWRLKDVSLNGVFINGSEDRVPKGETISLSEGDLIKLGDYELEFSSRAAPVAQPEQEETDFFATPKLHDEDQAEQKGKKEINTPLSQMDEGLLADQISIDEIHGLNAPPEDPDPPSLQGREERVSALRHHINAPEAVPDTPEPVPEAPQGSNDDPMAKYRLAPDQMPDPQWDEKTGTWKSVSRPDPPAEAEIDSADSPKAEETEPVKEEKKNTPSVIDPPVRDQDRPKPAKPKVPIVADSALAAFAIGAGLDPSKFKPEDEAEFFSDLGHMMRNMTEGLMQALTSRRQVKREFRVDETQVAVRDNNPLKWVVSADEALIRLLTSKDTAYLGGPEAVSQALDDLNAHQLAALAGTEAALRHILSRFKPGNVESRLDGGSALGKLIPGVNKARLWEFYKAIYNEMSEAADDDFQHLFGSHFRKAYEDQLDRITRSRKESTE